MFSNTFPTTLCIKIYSGLVHPQLFLGERRLDNTLDNSSSFVGAGGIRHFFSTPVHTSGGICPGLQSQGGPLVSMLCQLWTIDSSNSRPG